MTVRQIKCFIKEKHICKLKQQNYDENLQWILLGIFTIEACLEEVLQLKERILWSAESFAIRITGEAEQLVTHH